MHKLLIPLIFLYCLKTDVFCQEKSIELGLELGASRSYLSGNSIIEKYHALWSYTAGLSFQSNLSNHFSLRTGLAFERKGAQDKVEVTDDIGMPIGDVNFYIYYDYFTVPLLVRYSFGRNVTFFGNAGMYFALLDKSMIVLDEFEGLPETFIDQTSGSNSTDYGIVLGAGCLIPLKNNFAFSAEVRHNKGLFNTSNLEVIDHGQINMNSTNLLLGMVYRFGSKSIAITD